MFEEYTPPGIDADALQNTVNSGANWFFWIAGLSLINSMIIFFEGSWSFAVGLGITQVFDGVALAFVENGAGGWIKLAALVADIVVVCIFIGFGFLGRARHVWAFIVGMLLFAIDTLILIAAFDVLGIIIHAVALFFLFGGLSAARRLNAELAGTRNQNPEAGV